MDRQIVYPGSIPLDTDVLSFERNVMIALGYLAQAALGTSVFADGLACTQQTVPDMTVNIGPGSITTLQTIDSSAFGSLNSDANPLVKMCVNRGTTLSSALGTMTAPGTSGQSVVYLVQASFQESDATAVVLPYYNSANPSVAYSGPANAGTPQNTQRLQVVNLGLKSGTPATTGSQTAPTPDSGFVGLWTITVAHAQTTVVTGNIALYPTAPFIDPLKVGRGVQPGRLVNVQTISSTGTYIPTAGTNKVRVTIIGGGGAGGGAASTSTGQFASGGGGQAGATGIGLITSGFSGVTITIGAAGVGVSASKGGSGGASSFGALITAPGGEGGSSSGASSSSANAAGGTAGTTASGGNIVNLRGQFGAGGTGSGSAGFGFGGLGGSTQYGAGGPWASPALGFGSGGGGASNGASQAAQAGPNGAPGICIIEEYS